MFGLFTLPNILTEAENSFCKGPTSFKSLGTLLILSLNKIVNATLPLSIAWVTGYPSTNPGKYTL